MSENDLSKQAFEQWADIISCPKGSVERDLLFDAWSEAAERHETILAQEKRKAFEAGMLCVLADGYLWKHRDAGFRNYLGQGKGGANERD